ncbi:neuropeptide CCHamide-1 receptor-like [Linepithema humile]|uniref:neuropeptide CCHamide-1 receptor-like n=1 Tax=Linepithema humile TaxID=83485 RepID=UPI00062367F5|nr:PREDICTED: gastrin-releasing peptide receptor-like [Linepithema humile]XP_012217557.1 PREDICTED: gastrin-releasing peptide receptor-like [Linepithema humile]
MSLSYVTNTSPASMLMETARSTTFTLTSNCTECFNVTNEFNETWEVPYIPYRERPETYFVPIIFFLIEVIGLTGNGVLALTILRHSSMRNGPNAYILSLAIGDILVLLICVPFVATIYVFESWYFGLIMCKAADYAKDLSVGISVFALTALSADRYFAIVDPWKFHATGSKRRTMRFAAAFVGLIWFLAIVCATPAVFSYLRYFKVNRHISFHVCYPFPEEFGPNYPKLIVMGRFVFYYMIPLCTIGIFNILMSRHLMRSTRNVLGQLRGQMRQMQARIKLAKMVKALVIIFAICFLPQHVFMLWFYFNPNSQNDYNYFWHYFRILGFCLAFINSCINPIALYFMSQNFRKYFNRYLFCCATKRVRKTWHQWSSDISSRRWRSFSRVNSRKERDGMPLSTMVSDMRPSNTPIKEQETTLTATFNK